MICASLRHFTCLVEATRQLRRQQDEEYAASLRADRARHLDEVYEAEEAAARAAERERDLPVLERLRAEAAAALPPEPEGPNRGAAVCIRFLLPDGRRVQRWFPRDASVGLLHAFIFTEGFGNVQIFSTFPRAPIANSGGVTVGEALGAPSASLMVTPIDGKQED